MFFPSFLQPRLITYQKMHVFNAKNVVVLWLGIQLIVVVDIKLSYVAGQVL